MRIRVLSFNVHKGRAFISRKKTWQNLVALLRDQKPDVIFLQEFLKEKEGQRALEELSDSLWPHHAFGQNATWNGSHYGNAILSRYPLQETHNTDISNSAFERRGLLYGLVHPKPGKALHLFCCHLDLTHRGRAAQLKKIKMAAEKLVPPAAPLVLAGDFNDWQAKLHSHIQSAFHVKEAFVALNGRLEPSSPSLFPLFSLDRIYFRKMKPSSGGSIPSAGPWHFQSDHLPLRVDFEIL